MKLIFGPINSNNPRYVFCLVQFHDRERDTRMTYESSTTVSQPMGLASLLILNDGKSWTQSVKACGMVGKKGKLSPQRAVRSYRVVRCWGSYKSHSGKGSATTATGRGGPHSCETSRLPHFLDNCFKESDNDVSLTLLPRFTPSNIPNTHFCR
jgi:hypothetical protein